jgi:hypothetical protein
MTYKSLELDDVPPFTLNLAKKKMPQNMPLIRIFCAVILY